MIKATLRPARTGLERTEYRDIPLYQPDFRPAEIALHDNTNRFGVPPTALAALRDSALDAVCRYPAPYADELKRALASYTGVDAPHLATGCGSDDVIDSAIRAVSAPGDALAHVDPTFPMVPLFARMNGLAPVAVPLTAEHDLDAEAMLATGARVIYLCSPNNPTGGALSAAAIERVVAEAPGLVILDEAYAEFMDKDATWFRRAPQLERLLVTRTLSKTFGLAGLRIGYAAAAPGLAREVEKSRGPFKVGTVAARAAVAALDHDRDWVAASIRAMIESRTRFVSELRARGIASLPSQANFVLVPVSDAAATAAATRAAGVAVRPFPKLSGLGDAVRITIGPWSEMDAALRALEQAPR